MNSSKKILKPIVESLSNWTVLGSFKTALGTPPWGAVELDAAVKIPSGTVTVAGQQLKSVKTRAEKGVLDFRSLFGIMPERTGVFAFAESEFPSSGALTLSWHADFWGALWMDGREILSLDKGNMGSSIESPHKITYAVEEGRHVFCVRVMSGSCGWVSALSAESYNSELPDALRTDRGARWRDYSRSAVRLEERPAPDDSFGGLGMKKFESWTASAGVDARWIGLVDHIFGAFFQSENLPMSKNAKPEYEAQFKEWIELLHEKRFSVMTWLPMTLWRPAWEAHPDWRIKFLVDPPEGGESWGNNCCLNSPYGDALARFSVECLQKFDLDGIWFDGAGLHGGAVRQVVGCICPHCEKRFLKDTGRKLPSEYDWEDEDFRAWVQWRYDNFAENWQRLVDFIHAAVPEASIAFNHYHRENVGWNGSIPLNPFGHDFISATEVDYWPRRAAFYTKCMRAYDRGNAETWMGLSAVKTLTPRGELDNPKKVIDFALGCCVAGGHPSMGGYTPHLKQIADEIIMRAPYLNLPSAADVAIHVSQQTETFVFGRNPDFINSKWLDYYWTSAVGWSNILNDCTFTSDVIYDAHLTPENLSRFKLVIMPFACALSRAQYEVILEYVKNGGRILTGPWFGLFDPQGEKNKTADKKLFPFNGEFPAWEKMAGALYGSDQNMNPASTKLGDGEIMQFTSDIGGLYRRKPSKELLGNMCKLIKPLIKPGIEIVCEKGLHAGIFKRGENETVITLQCTDLAWESEDPLRTRPETRWGAKLIWPGEKPRSACAMLPDPSPDLPVKRCGGAWAIEMPPMTWGQVIIVKGK
jgi:hypothetical protein